MRYLAIFILFVAVAVAHGCQQDQSALRIAQLERKLAELEAKKKTGLGLMMNQIQIYHTKLYHAVKSENKPLIRYIIHEMEERFEEVTTVHKVHDEIPISEIAGATVLPALEQMSASLETADAARLMEEFDFVTVTCNKCHQASGHSYIRIRHPGSEGYLDQDFEAP